MAAFRVGGIAIESSACAIVDLGPLNAALGQPISFVLGMPAIVQADWSFDFPRRRWSVRPGRPPLRTPRSPACSEVHHGLVLSEHLAHIYRCNRWTVRLGTGSALMPKPEFCPSTRCHMASGLTACLLLKDETRSSAQPPLPRARVEAAMG